MVLSIDILNIKENQINELYKFTKDVYDDEALASVASKLKYTLKFKNIFEKQLKNPDDDFVKFFLKGTYDGLKTKPVIDKFKPLLIKSLNNYINELMNSKIKNALSANEEEKIDTEIPKKHLNSAKNKQAQIITTPEEIEAYFVVKNILKSIVPANEITYKDVATYFNVLYKNNTRKWICRFNLKPTAKYLILPGKDKNGIKHKINTIYDIENYKNELVDALNRYIKSANTANLS